MSSGLVNRIWQKSGKLTAVSRGPNMANGTAQWYCKCDCGNSDLTLLTGSEIGRQRVKSCGCSRKEVVLRKFSLIGERFDRLIVLSHAGSADDRSSLWLCRCDCGKEKVCRAEPLKNGRNKSCGCKLTEWRLSGETRTHGMSETPEYDAYCTAKSRCKNKANAAYKYYGGRGIRFKFKTFEDFFGALGPKPSSKYTLERIDNNGNYEKGNVKWATWAEQAANKRYANQYGRRTERGWEYRRPA